MGQWKVDSTSKPGVLMLSLRGPFEAAEMQEFVRAHNAAIDGLGGAPYRVFCDIRELVALSPEAAALMEQAKLHSAGKANFQGSAVLVASSLVAMQHRRTSTTGGVINTELISEDETACWEHLRRVRRTKQP